MFAKSLILRAQGFFHYIAAITAWYVGNKLYVVKIGDVSKAESLNHGCAFCNSSLSSQTVSLTVITPSVTEEIVKMFTSGVKAQGAGIRLYACPFDETALVMFYALVKERRTITRAIVESSIKWRTPINDH